MKRVFLLPLIMGLVLCSCVVSANAQSDRKYNKEMEKVYKKKTKELKKEGWKVTGVSLTLEAAIMKHFRAVNSDAKNKELTTNVSMCKSLNVCSVQALNNALVRYAENAGSYVRGRVVSDLFNNASGEVPEEFDKFYAAYERLVSAEIKGEVQFSVAFEKNNGDGRAYQAWFIVNEDKAAQARVRAMQRAFEETKLAQRYANQVADFVRTGFQVEGDR
ncbi:MAG: hypothetical protein LBK97_03120 [Prevotellaceae bacterium]|jgi:hypothetical protein|nr:hypothetical protein [Prevotellaceae bacterium]